MVSTNLTDSEIYESENGDIKFIKIWV